MDLGIKELGITFMVGAFTILGFELILYYFFGIRLTGFFQGERLGLDDEEAASTSKDDKKRGTHAKDETKEHAMKTAVFIGLAFAVGILAEDLSYKYVDSVETPFKTLPASISTVLPDELNRSLDLPSKYDSRISTLMGHLKEHPQPQWLTIDLARNGAFSLTDPENGVQVERWIQDPNRCIPTNVNTPACPSSDAIANSILRLYYYAKNRVYDKENYYDEMKRIQTRLEFSRSISMIAFIYFLIALVISVVLSGVWVIKRKSMSDKQARLGKSYVRIPAVLLILFVIYFFGIWSYERESDEFNKRAFGYFSSMLLAEKLENSGKSGAQEAASAQQSSAAK